MKRQLEDYYGQYYHKLENRSLILKENHYEKLHQLIHWKEKMVSCWDQIEFIHLQYDNEKERVFLVGENVNLSVQLKLGAIKHNDINIDLCIVNAHEDSHQLFAKYPLEFVKNENGISTFILEMCAAFSGSWKTAIRITPKHELLPHIIDFPLIKWI